MRVIEHAFPAHGGTGLFHVGTHDDEDFVVQLRSQLRQTVAVFQGGFGVVEGAGPGDHQQAGVFAIENVANGLALVLNLRGECGIHRQALTQYRGGGQRQAASRRGLTVVDWAVGVLCLLAVYLLHDLPLILRRVIVARDSSIVVWRCAGVASD